MKPGLAKLSIIQGFMNVFNFQLSSSSGAVRMRSYTEIYKLTHAAFLFFCATDLKETVHVYKEFPREKQRSSRSSKVPKQLSRPDSRFGTFFIVHYVLVYLAT